MPIGDYSLGRAVLELVSDPTKIRSGIGVARAEATASLSSIQKSLTAAGTQITATGQKMTTGITLPVVAAGAAIVKVGTDFSSTLNQIVGLTDVTRDQIGGIKDEILAMGATIGKSPQELAEAFYFVASAGFTAKEAMDVLRTAATASAAGLGTTQDIAKVLGLTLNAYGHENITSAHAADILTAAVKDGTAEADAFASVLGRVIPTAATLGVSFDQVTAALASMTLTGLSADEASTSLNQVLVSLLKPTSEAQKTMAELGLSAGELRSELREKGLLATLRTLETAFGANEDAAAKVFGNVRALRGVLSLLTLDSEQLNKVFADTAGAQGDLAEGYKETEGPARAFERSQAAITADLITLADDVLPVAIELLHDIAGAIHFVVGAFRSLPPEVRSTIVMVLALLAAVGPVLIIVGSITSAVGGLIGILRPLAFLIFGEVVPAFIALAGAVASTAIEAFGAVLFATGIPALEALGVALVGVEIAAAPVLLVIGAIIALGAGLAIAMQRSGDQIIELNRKAEIVAARTRVSLERARVEMGLSADGTMLLADANRIYGKDATDAALAAQRAGEKVGLTAGSFGVVREAVKETADAHIDYWTTVQDSLNKALDAQQTYTSNALDSMQKFRTDLEGLFGVTQDALFATAETAAKITIKNAELIASDKALVDAQKKGDKQSIASAVLKRIGILKELNELKLHSALIGTEIEQTTKLTSILTSKEMKDGLTSKYPEVKTSHQALRDSILASLQTIANKGGPAAGAAAKAIRAQLDPKTGTSPLAGSGAWGYATTQAFMLGASSGIRDYFGPIRAGLRSLGNLLRATSPPGPESPLHEVDIWGERTGDAWGLPLVRSIASIAMRLREPLQAIGSTLGGGFLPRDMALAGAAAAVGAMPVQASGFGGMAARARGGDSYQTTLIMQGRPTSDPLEALHRAARYQRFRVINPPPVELEEGTVNA